MSTKSKAYRELTDERVHEVCEYVATGVSTEHACALVGVSRDTLKDVAARDDERGHRTSAPLARARAKSAHRWLLRLDKASNSAEVKKCMHMLCALDNRFRDDLRSLAGGLVVMIDVAGPGQTSVRIAARATDSITDSRSDPTALLTAPEPSKSATDSTPDSNEA